MSRKLPAALALILLAGAACDSGIEREGLSPRTPLSTPRDDRARVIGVVGTLSGTDAWRGTDAFEGADVAVQQLNRSLEDDEDPFALVTLDDEGDPTRAKELVAQLTENERTVGIVYGGPTVAAAPTEVALADSGIPMIVCYGDLYGARQLQPHIFQASPPLTWQARRIASYLVKDRGYEKVGLIATSDLDGRTAQFGLTQALQDQGARPPVVVSVGPDSDLSQARDKLRRQRVEALVIQGNPTLGVSLDTLLDRRRNTYRGTIRARIASARPKERRRKLRRGDWHPQVVGFDQMIVPDGGAWPAGTVAAESYARGSHYLPVPSFEQFDRAFMGWWDQDPIGFERRAYEATLMIGWAARNGDPDDDLARVLETLRGERFGGLDVVFGPDDHTAIGETTIGLWVVPRPGAAPALPPPDGFRWAPLSRGFSINGRRTTVLPEDWRYLFRRPPPPDGPSPKIGRARFAVATPRSDPIH